MLCALVTACAVLVSFIGSALAHNIQMAAHSRECFHETLHKDDKMTVTFQVGDREFGGSGNLEIDFWVRAPGLVAPIRAGLIRMSKRFLIQGRVLELRY